MSRKDLPATCMQHANTELTLQLVVPGTLFQPGDYIVRARTADNKARQTYTYHVLPRENSEQK